MLILCSGEQCWCDTMCSTDVDAASTLTECACTAAVSLLKQPFRRNSLLYSTIVYSCLNNQLVRVRVLGATQSTL
jgi:hypothetical protein